MGSQDTGEPGYATQKCHTENRRPDIEHGARLRYQGQGDTWPGRSSHDGELSF